MNLKLEIEFSKAPILQEVDALKKQIDDVRPLSPEIEGRVMQKLRLDWNYNSNAIEGNKLSYGETTALLMHGVTAKGKPLKDHLDIQGHNQAIEYLESLIRDGRGFTEMDIRALHEVILVKPYDVEAETSDGVTTHKQIQLGKYKSMPNHVKTITGEIHYYSSPEETPAKMNDLMDWYNATIEDKDVHPIVIAALFHHKFVSIHPFDDGNGRIARILMNLILMQNSYPPVVVKKEDRQNYYALLSQADSGDGWPFIEYIADRLTESLKLYVKAINGDEIEEDDDIDKEIALFKIELNNDMDLELKKSYQVIVKVIQENILPLTKKIISKSKAFDELFFINEKFFRYRFMVNGTPSSKRIVIKNNNIETVGVPEQDIGTLECHFTFKDFKKAKNMFAVSTAFKVFFEQYNYVISYSDRSLKKYYHEKISNDELQLFTKDVIKNLMEQISLQIKESPKS